MFVLQSSLSNDCTNRLVIKLYFPRRIIHLTIGQFSETNVTTESLNFVAMILEHSIYVKRSQTPIVDVEFFVTDFDFNATKRRFNNIVVIFNADEN